MIEFKFSTVTSYIICEKVSEDLFMNKKRWKILVNEITPFRRVVSVKNHLKEKNLHETIASPSYPGRSGSLGFLLCHSSLTYSILKSVFSFTSS